MIRLNVSDGKTILDLSDFVQSVEVSGYSDKFNREMHVTLNYTTDGRKPAYSIAEGQTIAFQWNKEKIFSGYIFGLDITSDGTLNLTCYDANVYLAKNYDTLKFKNKKASDIIKTLARDYGIKVGTIADTKYVIPTLIFRNKSLYEMILTALTLTRKQTGKRYFIGNKDGQLTLTEAAEPKERFLISVGSNITSASYSRSIEETKTRVKVTGGSKKKPVVAVVSDESLRKKYGTMQYLEEMDEKATASQVKQRAATLLKEMAVINDQANVEALGTTGVITGSAVYVIEPMTGLGGAYYVTSDTHRWNASGLYTMSLEITRTYDLPPLEIDKEVLGK